MSLREVLVKMPPPPAEEPGFTTYDLLGRLVVMLAAGLFVGLLVIMALHLIGCGPSQHPCVTAYEKAGDCPECSGAEIEARVKAVDATCEHMLLSAPSASASVKP